VKYTIITNAGGGAGDALINGGGLCGSAWLAHDHRQVLGKVISGVESCTWLVWVKDADFDHNLVG
jgi:hypothetical protein